MTVVMTLEDQIEFIEFIKEMCVKAGTNHHRYQAVLDSLKELQDRRSADLRPCDKFTSNGLREQVEHIASEFQEVMEEISLLYLLPMASNYNEVMVKASEELVDLQMSCETMLAILGLNEQQRRDMRRQVIEKNKARGYYEKSNG